jgi:SAM-dependent methyltransferase
MASADHLLRVHADDPAYRAQAEAEARFWEAMHPFGLESNELRRREGPVDRHINLRLAGAEDRHWYDLVAGHGPFRRALVLGTSSLTMERCLLETNPHADFTFVDLAPGALERRLEAFGARFRGRVAVRAADLNFLTLEPGAFDLIVSSSTVHHVTNLEHLAFQIGEALTADGWMFLHDYVGPPRMTFDTPTRRLVEEIYQREVRFTPGRTGGVGWKEPTDLSPFCALRSEDILAVFRAHLAEVEVRTCGALAVPIMRITPLDGVTMPPPTPWQQWRDDLLRRLFGRRLAAHEEGIGLRFLNELLCVDDVVIDAGLAPPCLAFATYRRRLDVRPAAAPAA